MEKLDIKRGHSGRVEGEKLLELMNTVFGNCKEEEGWYISNYGAMQPIKARVMSKSELVIEINTVKIPEDRVLDTMRKRNIFLEEATGFTSKQRLKRLKEKAKKGTI